MKKIPRSQQRRKMRVSANIIGTHEVPRVAVYRSNHYIYVQAIDDSKQVTIAAHDSQKLEKKTMNKKDASKATGIEFAQKLQALKITKAVFDRSRFRYLGRVQALADGLREGGIQV